MPLPAVKKVRHPCALLLVLGYFYFGLLVYFKHSFYVNFLGPVVFLLQKVHAPRASFHELSVQGKKKGDKTSFDDRFVRGAIALYSIFFLRGVCRYCCACALK